MKQKQNLESKQGITLAEDDLFPEEWEIGRLRNVAEIHPSNIDKKSRDDEVDVRLCNYTEVYNYDEIDEGLEFMEATAKPSKVSRFRLRKGDVIITKDSESRDEIGIPARVVRDFDDVVCGYHLFLIRPDSSRIDPDFLFWVLNSQLLASQFEQSANGVTRYGLTTLDASNTAIPIPPKEYQEQILQSLTRAIDDIGSVVERYSTLIDQLHQKRRTTIRNVATTGVEDEILLENSGVGWIGEVPEHWDVVRTRFVARLESGHTPSKSNDEYWEDCNIPWVTTSDIKPLRSGRKIHLEDTKYKISQLGLENSGARLLPEDTVFVSRTASVGFSGIMADEMATSQDFANWVCGDQIIPEYLLYVFRSMNQEFDRLMQGSTHQTIYMPDIRSFKTPLPPVEEQREIVEHIQNETEQLWTLIDNVEEAIDLLEEKRQALITAAVTGQIDVTEERDAIQDHPV